MPPEFPVRKKMEFNRAETRFEPDTSANYNASNRYRKPFAECLFRHRRVVDISSARVFLVRKPRSPYELPVAVRRGSLVDTDRRFSGFAIRLTFKPHTDWS